MSSPISARAWNATATMTNNGLLPVGREQTMGGGGNLPFGRVINRGRVGAWKHPFTITPMWRPFLPLTPDQKAATQRSAGAWTLTVEPGYINGWAPAIWMPTRFVGDDAAVWGNKYDPANTPEDPTSRIQVLIDDPLIVPPFMTVTSFADATAVQYEDGQYKAGSYPMFFKYNMRVKQPEQLDGVQNFLNTIAELDRGTPMPSILEGEEPAGQQLILDILAGNKDVPGTLFQEPDYAFGPRNLYSCDVVLKIERPKRVQQFEQDEFGILRLAGFTIEAPQQVDYQATLYTTARWTPPDFFSFEELMMGLQPPDPGYDEIVVGRVYFVSPDIPDAPSPDGSWMPFVDHSIYWNLNYASQQIIDPFHPDRSLDYFKAIGAVLGVGSAYLIIGSYADMIEVQYDTIANAMNKTDMSGSFWNG